MNLPDKIFTLDCLKVKYVLPSTVIMKLTSDRGITTQQALARFVRVSQSTISFIVNNKRGLTEYTARKFAEFFELPFEDFMVLQADIDKSFLDNKRDSIFAAKKCTTEVKRVEKLEAVLAAKGETLESAHRKVLLKVLKNVSKHRPKKTPLQRVAFLMRYLKRVQPARRFVVIC